MNDSIIIGSKNIYHDIDCKINRVFFILYYLKDLLLNFMINICNKFVTILELLKLLSLFEIRIHFLTANLCSVK